MGAETARRRRTSRRWRAWSTGSAPTSSSVIEGKPEVVASTLVVLLAEGHLLIEDVPGVGKTMLSKALARSIDCIGAPHPVHARPAAVRRHRRLGLQPGHPRVRVPARRRLRQHRGRRRDQPRLAQDPVGAARSAWRSARSPSTTRPTSLEPPFMVIATQNPIEMEGTYALPEAQRDRFMARVSMGYPVEAAEIAMLDSHTGAQPARRPRAGHRRGRGPPSWSASSARSTSPRPCSGTPSR